VRQVYTTRLISELAIEVVGEIKKLIALRFRRITKFPNLILILFHLIPSY